MRLKCFKRQKTRSLTVRLFEMAASGSSPFDRRALFLAPRPGSAGCGVLRASPRRYPSLELRDRAEMITVIDAGSNNKIRMSNSECPRSRVPRVRKSGRLRAAGASHLSHWCHSDTQFQTLGASSVRCYVFSR